MKHAKPALVIQLKEWLRFEPSFANSETETLLLQPGFRGTLPEGSERGSFFFFFFSRNVRPQWRRLCRTTHVEVTADFSHLFS